MKRVLLVCLCIFLLASLAGAAQPGDAWLAATPEQITAVLPDVESLYLDLHRNPEISLFEKQTADKLAQRMKALGYDVTTGVGGTGVVAILKNGPGPTVLIRAELDALPMPERTGLPYASTVTMKNAAGATVPVMHACGHDLHMSVWYGTAKIMAANRDRWHGTLMFVGQPAEEIGAGAAAMLKDGLYARFPKPNFALALHDDSAMLAGMAGFTPGFNLSSADSIDITIFGRGSHGAEPNKGVDPIVIGSRVVVALQTIVGREVTPGDPAVVTVGSFHGGTQYNIIPDEVKLQLTVRTYKPETREMVLNSLQRIVKAEALAAGAPKEPVIVINHVAPSAYNDPELNNAIVKRLRQIFGSDKVVEVPPKMAFDDFAYYRTEGVREVMLTFGAIDQARYDAAQKPGAAPLPGLHSSLYYPAYSTAIRSGITQESAALLVMLGSK
jgi:hippurate hydrolase